MSSSLTHFDSAAVVIVGQGENAQFITAFDVHRNLLGKVTVGHRGRHFRDVAYLAGKVAGHEVHIVGQVFPGSGDAHHLGLTTQFALGTDFTGHAVNFRSK
jgi:hypothetical protein